MDDRITDDPVEGAAFLVAMLTLPLGILSALFFGFTTALVVFVVGWLFLTPLLLFVSQEVLSALRDRSKETAAGTDDDPLAQLKSRYARGEIDDAEFERRVERLVGVEDLDASDPATESLDDRELSVGRE